MTEPQAIEDERWMRRALELAQEAQRQGEVPVGAVLVVEGESVGEAFNAPISGCDPTAHAEVAALRYAAKNLGNYRLPQSTLYVTIEPCTMCFGALMHARVSRLVFGAREPRAGVVCSQLGLAERDFYNHSIAVVEGVLQAECSELLSSFFRSRRR